MRDAVIVSAVRTAVGKAPKGTLRTTRPDEMGATVIKEALARVPGLETSEIEDVIMGCAMPEAEQGMNVARICALKAGVPDGVPAMTINRFCSSGLQSIAMAAERILAGAADVIVAGGTESMTIVPMGGNKPSFNPELIDNRPEIFLPMGLTAEQVVRMYKVTREDQDEFAYRSHMKAIAAIREGKFREDLYYRLAVIPIRIPSLRERADDILLLARYFLERARQALGKDVHGFAREATEWLLQHRWPGNVRELENVVERAVTLARGAEVSVADLGTEFNEPVGAGGALRPSLAEMEEQYIRRVLEETQGDKVAAARILGLSVRTLQRRFK